MSFGEMREWAPPEVGSSAGGGWPGLLSLKAPRQASSEVMLPSAGRRALEARGAPAYVITGDQGV